MGTRSVIAKPVPAGDTPTGGFIGTYCHWDGYPSGVGRTLWEVHHGHFGGDVDAMVTYFVDDELVGWSSICGADFSLPKAWNEIGEDPCQECGRPLTGHGTEHIYADPRTPKGPQSYTARGETDEWRVKSNGDDGGAEWAYVLMPDALVVYKRRGDRWVLIGTCPWDGDEPDWESMETKGYAA